MLSVFWVYCKLYHILMIFHRMTPRAARRVGVIQWKIIKLWYNLKYSQNTESINGLSVLTQINHWCFPYFENILNRLIFVVVFFFLLFCGFGALNTTCTLQNLWQLQGQFNYCSMFGKIYIWISCELVTYLLNDVILYAIPCMQLSVVVTDRSESFIEFLLNN